VSAAISEAHAQRLRVTVDAYGDFTTMAIEAGADGIEHTLAMPESAIALMARRNTALVPTLTTYHALLTHGAGGLPPGGYYHDSHRSYAMTHAGNLRVVRAAHAAGVRIGVGTDMGFAGERQYPGCYFTEMGFLRDAGLSDAQVLASATRVAAEILGLGDLLGTLERGKLADVLVVEGDPLADMTRLRNLRLLIADGRIVRDRLAKPGASP
jgi:imidazolonepropionase-like amidohydrolase